ncbi:hypothetical protein [Micromonospora haikouensis]|uniref:hypothetical protein n=1 Tax=Micromonospora haikouensis TaxID=686309 RepID=UPI00114D0E53|nr:hypothetical protein [Micromonospora haikouensis]
MTIFACLVCGMPLTGDLAETALSDEPSEQAANDHGVPVTRVRPGRFAVDPEPFGPPYVPTTADPQVHVSDGPRGTILVNPNDVHGLGPHPDPSRRKGCCRLDGLDGPNLVCRGCGSEVATEQSDCWVRWHDLRLQPAAVTASRRAR